MAYIKVLTKAAEETAAGKKDGAGSFAADKRLFFSKVRAIAGNKRLFAGLA
jgi:hypothetical protein